MDDIDGLTQLLELDQPFTRSDVQAARRRLTKLWHPDQADPERRAVYEEHLQEINDAADKLEQFASDAPMSGEKPPAHKSTRTSSSTSRDKPKAQSAGGQQEQSSASSLLLAIFAPIMAGISSVLTCGCLIVIFFFVIPTIFLIIWLIDAASS